MAIHGYKGGVISATAPTVSPSSASGVWTLDEQLQNSAEWPITNTLLSNSSRIRASATAYMSRTPTVASNRRTWTWSGWVKRGSLGETALGSFGASSTTDGYVAIYFTSSDTLTAQVRDAGSNKFKTTTQVFRDPSAWYHIVVAVDTTQATAGNRIKFYVNGTQVTSFSADDTITQNLDTSANNTVSQQIGAGRTSGGSFQQYFDGYLADINFIDGQALTPNYFGATNPNTGVWQPAQFHGTYGTNGFYLPMNIEQLQVTFSNSLRFRASASAYLSRTFGTPTNQKIWTYSFWFKRGTLSTDQGTFIGNNSGTDQWYFRLSANNTLYIGDYYNDVMTTTPVYRDPASWYHIVLAIDTTQATATDRIKLYVNGVQQSYTQGARFPSQNFNIPLNQSSLPVVIGSGSGFTGMDGYMTNVNFIDGLQLAPNLFGTTDATSGAWVPVTYAGSYGTNGFYLPFTNNTSTTTLGYDFSGLGNNWTTNNISVTAGSTYDSMTDVPTLTSATASNFCTLNPLSVTAGSMTDGNLYFSSNTTAFYGAKGTIELPTTGKYYFEARLSTSGTSNAEGGDYTLFGVILTGTNTNNAYDRTTFCAFGDNGWVFNFNSNTNAVGSALSSGDVIAMAIDRTANTYTFYRNNSSVASGTLGVASGTALIPLLYSYGSTIGRMSVNFGQQPFAYTPPTGYVALNTYNM